MIKKFAVFAVALAFLVSTQAADARKKKVYRIGYLSYGSAQVTKGYVASFRQGLQDLGYSEGKDILIEERYAGGRRERLPALVRELVRLKVDIIVTHGSRSALTANRVVTEAGKKIPIVAAVFPGPRGSGLAAGLPNLGGNIAGLTDFHAHLVPKRLELLKEIAPSVSRVAVLWNPALPPHPLKLKEIQAAAPAFGVKILPLEVKKPDDIERAFATIRKERAEALFILGGPMIATRLKQIAEFSLKDRLPSIYSMARYPDVGGLMSYGANFHDLYRRAASYVDKILKGAKPADLPVEQPKRFKLVINRKTADALGLTIPQSILVQADRVLE